jgi:hypothetical protein
LPYTGGRLIDAIRFHSGALLVGSMSPHLSELLA